jgi:hypothetical protein
LVRLAVRGGVGIWIVTLILRGLFGVIRKLAAAAVQQRSRLVSRARKLALRS